MKKVNSDGTVTYYYYQKKKGRHKKRGPKPKKIKTKKIVSLGKWEYKIVACSAKKQTEYVGKYKTLEEAYSVKNRLLEANKDVLFPQEYIVRGNKNDILSQNEYLILKKCDSGNTVSQLSNEYGKYVSVSTNLNNWSIYERFEQKKEETFRVIGYNPVKERKTASWIIDTLIPELSEDSILVRLYLYGNKLCLLNDDKQCEFIICKNKTDCIRLYNFIIDNSPVSIIGNGDVANSPQERKKIISLIIDKTNWDKNKIYHQK